MMLSGTFRPNKGFLVLFALSIATHTWAQLLQTLCSSLNTASDGPFQQIMYNSNSACTKACQGYAFGIVQFTSCWCSNFAPGVTEDISNCNEGCPGFPMEHCGNEDNHLFGYLALDKPPQGTVGGPSPSPTPTPTPEPDTVTAVVTSIAVSVESQPVSVSIAVSSVIITPEPETTSTPVSTPSPSSTPTPTPTLSILTVSGGIKTILVTPSNFLQSTATVAPADSDAVSSQPSGFFSNQGAVAGVFTVVGLVVAGLIAGLLFFFWRRRRDEGEGSERLNSMEEDRHSVVPSTFMSRRTSELGLRTDVPRIGTSDDKTPTSMHVPGPGLTSRRTSMPLTDQRLNPAHLYHDNGSHLSVTSLQDNRDYSRPVLQVANPDRPGSSAIEDD